MSRRFGRLSASMDDYSTDLLVSIMERGHLIRTGHKMVWTVKGWRKPRIVVTCCKGNR